MRVAPNTPQNISVNSSVIIVRDGPELPKAFSPADIADLQRLQNRNGVVTRLEGNAVSRRALLLRDQSRFIDGHGVVSVNAYARKRGFDYEAASLVYHVSAQLLLDMSVTAAPEADKEAIQNEVSLLARALDELAARKGEHEHLTDDEFVAWYKAEGRISGLANSYRDRKRASKAQASADAGGDEKTTVTTDAQKVDAIFNNPAAVEIDALPGIPTGREGLFMYRQEGDKVRLIPLASTPAKMAELAGLAPSPLAHAPKDLTFHRQVLMAGAALVPDEMSNVTIEEVPEGDIANDSYDMLPANAMYLVERGRISIAHARRDDGLIIEVLPNDIDPGYALTGECYFDNLTRRRLGAAWLGEADAAQFAASAVDGVAARMTTEGRSKTLTFTHKESGAKVNLIVKPRTIGSVWTYRVSPDFRPVAQAVMDDAMFAKFDTSFAKAMLKKQPDREVTIKVDGKGIGFANGKAAALRFDADATGSAKVMVLLSDLRRAIVGLLALPLAGGLRWKLDPQGLLMIEASTDVAIFRVFVQTLEANRDQATRERKLRERVEGLPNAVSPVAHAA